MTLVNPHQFFDLSREEPDWLTCLRSVLRDGQLFRYVETERESANSLIEAHFADTSARRPQPRSPTGPWGSGWRCAR